MNIMLTVNALTLAWIIALSYTFGISDNIYTLVVQIAGLIYVAFYSVNLAARKDDKIEGLESDLDSAVEVAYHRGATEWVQLNYPQHFERLSK